jgi:hypothetical protein
MGKRIALFVVVALVVVLVGIGVFARLDEGIARYSPAAVELEKVIGFVGLATLLMIAFAVAGFALFRFLFWRLVVLRSHEDVRRLRHPWVWALVGVFLLDFVVTLVMALAAANLGQLDKMERVPVIGWALYTALAFAAVATGLYWIFTLISVPDKLKYTPLGRYQIVGLRRGASRRAAA